MRHIITTLLILSNSICFADEIPELINNLGSNLYSERDYSTQKLIEMQEKPIEALKKYGITSTDLEIKSRSYYIIQKYYSIKFRFETVPILAINEDDLKFTFETLEEKIKHENIILHYKNLSKVYNEGYSDDQLATQLLIQDLFDLKYTKKEIQDFMDKTEKRIKEKSANIEDEELPSH